MDANLDWVSIDWSKVKSIEAVLLILQSLDIKVVVGSQTFQKLKPFLKD